MRLLPIKLDYPAKSGAAIFLSLSLTAASSPALAETLFTTSYEDPAYVVGALDGQDGWETRFFDTPFVTSAFSLTGAQSVAVLGGALTTQTFGFDTLETAISISQAVYLSGPDPFPADFVSPIAVNGDDGFIGQVAIRNGGASLGGAADNDVGFVPVPTGEWFMLELVLDFETQTQQAYVDDQFIGSDAFASASTEITSLDIFILNGTFGFPGDPTAPVFLDDLTITTVPLPPAIWLLGTALIGMARMSRRGATTR